MPRLGRSLFRPLLSQPFAKGTRLSVNATQPPVSPSQNLVLRLLLLNMFTALLLVAVLSVFGGMLASQYLNDVLTRNFEMRAEQLIERLDREVYERWLDIQVFSRNLTFTDPDTPPDVQRAYLDVMRAYLDVMRDRYDFYAWGGFANPDGVIIAATGGLLEGESVAMRPSFINGKRAVYIGDLHDDAMLGSTNRNARLIDLSAPVYDTGTGRLIGVLMAQIDWWMLSELIQSLHARATLPDWINPSVDLFVLSADGYVILDNVLSSSDPYALFLPEVLANNGLAEWSGLTAWPDGQTYVTVYTTSTGYRDFPGLNYRVILRKSQTEVSSFVTSLQAAGLAVGAVCVVLFGLVTFGALRVLMRPLRRIAVAATLLRSGQTQVDLPVYTGQDEVSLLSRALQEAFSALNQRNTQLITLNNSLEQRIEERTAALERNNRELANEIATRKQIETSLTESRESFRRLAETSFDGIAITVDGVVIYSNRALLNIFGYEQFELIKMEELEFIAPECRAIVRDIFNLADHRLHELVGVRKNGERFPIEISGRTLRYTGSMAHVITVRDLSARRTAP